ncbi:hypothetical protein RFI_36529, partial [Reticulomyxa filosa]
RLLQKDPKQRMSWTEFFAHPWLLCNKNVEQSKNNGYDCKDEQQCKTGKVKEETKEKENSSCVPQQKVNIDKNCNRQHVQKDGHLDRHSNLKLPIFSVTPLLLISSLINSQKKKKKKKSNETQSHKNNNMNLKSTQIKFEQLKQLEQYANLLLEIGDRKVSQDEVGNALLLYLKGLDLHDHVTTQIQLWLNSYSCILVHTNTSPQTQHNEENTHSDNDDPSSPMTLKTYSQMFSQLLLESVEKFCSYCQRGQAIRRLCEQNQLTFQMTTSNVNELLYNEAIQLSRKAASDLMLGDTSSVEPRLQQAQLLFQYLSSLPQILSVDKMTLDKC